MTDQPQMEPWMLPGVFVICTISDWAPPDDPAIRPLNPPKAGKVYTLSGAIRYPYGIAFALAEYPHHAFDAAHFTHVPHHEHMLFRRMLLNPHLLVDAKEITINGRVH